MLVKPLKLDPTSILKDHGIQPSAQRIAVASYVLNTSEHPSADKVWGAVRQRFPVISRATVYNTPNLFVRKKLIRQFYLAEGRVVFDPKMDRHHHFIDEESGRIYDVPWDAVEVSGIDSLNGFRVRDYHVVIHGRRARNGV